MDASTKVVLGLSVFAGIGILLLIKRREAEEMLLASKAPNPLPRPAFVQLPTSTNAVSRTADPPANATVPPGAFIATFKDPLKLSTREPTANGPVPDGTLLANVTLTNDTPLRPALQGVRGLGGDFPVLWVSPEGDRLAFTVGEAVSFVQDLNIPNGSVIIAHKA